MKIRLTSIESGIAGEYFVAAELSRRGLIATLTIKNTKGIDILAARHTGQSVGIQVKTAYNSGKEWLLSKSAETAIDPNYFYVFVNLNNGKEPSYHIVPSVIVADRVARHHKEWLAGTKKDGGQRKDVDLRSFIDRACEYKDRWELLGLDE